ncbi:hypothetical protein DY000_02045937 [Brassica cretica]|uniref:Uncharacterized protein n=1 Tax=Brassica cretica TaxID=69181 RepID=A0ABQ7F3K6_BRACR|nr:hypothetical protein DY000_02045937 [Brassica cretica]
MNLFLRLSVYLMLAYPELDRQEVTIVQTVDPIPLSGRTANWIPAEANVFASSFVDGTVAVRDVRVGK